MPYKISDWEGEKARTEAAAPAPFGPAFTPEVVAKTTRLELWGSSFTDPGADWCEHRAFDASGALLDKRRRAGY